MGSARRGSNPLAVAYIFFPDVPSPSVFIDHLPNDCGASQLFSKCLRSTKPLNNMFLPVRGARESRAEGAPRERERERERERGRRPTRRRRVWLGQGNWGSSRFSREERKNFASLRCVLHVVHGSTLGLRFGASPSDKKGSPRKNCKNALDDQT